MIRAESNTARDKMRSNQMLEEKAQELNQRQHSTIVANQQPEPGMIHVSSQ